MQSSSDDHWSKYYRTGKDFGLITPQALSEVLSHTRPDLPKTCLDIGCGTGQLTRELFHRGYFCIGIDASSEAVSRARQYTDRPEIRYIHFDIEADDIRSLPSRSYSLITCKLVYAFITNAADFLQSIGALLDKDGTFVVITPTYTEVTEATPISVQYDATLEMFERFFSEVVAYNPTRNLTCYICHK